MQLKPFGALLFIWVASATVQADASPTAPTRDCGVETDLATIERYFSDLRDALERSGPRTRFNKFVRSRFGVASARGRTLYFDVRDIGSVTPGRISIEEWREISRRGALSLQSAGWRGCFMDHGKVWFEGGRDFRLTFFNRFMPWVAATRDSVAP